MIDIANRCTQLQELDISGCWRITNKSLYALQENLLHMREGKSDFSLMVGGAYCNSINFIISDSLHFIGTDISGEAVIQFAAVTDSSICLHNLSVVSLQADYNPLLEPGLPVCYCTT